MAKKKLSAQDRAIHDLTIQIKMGMARQEITAADLARQMAEPITTVQGWIRHPDTMNMRKWQKVNAILHLDPALFNTAAGFVRGGISI